MNIQTNYSVGFGSVRQFGKEGAKKIGGRVSKSKYKENCYKQIKDITNDYIRQIRVSESADTISLSDKISETLDSLLAKARKTRKLKIKG